VNEMSKRVKTRIVPRKRISTGLFAGSLILCTDNSGARMLKLVQVMGYKGVKRRVPAAAVGDMIKVSVKDGIPDMRKKMFEAVIVRQRKPYRRKDGSWIQFEDNAAVIITPEGEPKGSNVKGPVAREATDRWARLAGIAKMVV